MGELHTTFMKMLIKLIAIGLVLAVCSADFDDTPVPEEMISEEVDSTPEDSLVETSDTAQAGWSGKRAKMALNKLKNRAKKIRRVMKKLKKAHGKGWGRLKKFGKKLAKKVKGGWGRFKKKTVMSIKKKKGWGKKGWGFLKKKIAKAIKKTKKKASGWGKAMRKYNRWGELTESKFGSFKKHFERVRKKHVERVHKKRRMARARAHRARKARARARALAHCERRLRAAHLR